MADASAAHSTADSSTYQQGDHMMRKSQLRSINWVTASSDPAMSLQMSLADELSRCSLDASLLPIEHRAYTFVNIYNLLFLFSCIMHKAHPSSMSASDGALHLARAAQQHAAAQDSRVTFLQQPASPLAPVVRDAHIIVRPTRTEGGASLTVQEALELGRWAIASDAVPRPDGTRLFHNADADHLASILQSSIHDVRRGSMPPAMAPQSDAVQRIINLYERVLV